MPWMNEDGDRPSLSDSLTQYSQRNPQYSLSSQLPSSSSSTSVSAIYVRLRRIDIHYNYWVSSATRFHDQPAWLQLDSGTRTFSGKPGSNDVGSVTFQLIANDGQGPTPLSCNVSRGTRWIGGSRPFHTARNWQDSVYLRARSSIMFYPLQAFAFKFSPDTFLRTSPSTTYYAISGDNSPLPSWLEFDASILGFSGTTPPLVSPTTMPQSYTA